MSERPLPRPGRTPFGPGHGGEDPQGPMLMDKIYQAMAMGKTQEFFDSELNGNPHAIALARMVMGMDGMGDHMPPMPAPPKEEAKVEAPSESTSVPQDVVDAAMGADVKKLTELLKKHAGYEEQNPEETAQPAPEQGYTSREDLDALLAISAEHNVSVDWLMARALKLYVRDHKSTGRL